MTVYNKNGYLYLNFMLDGKRKQKALKMKDTPQNRKIADKEIVPQLLKKIALGDYGKEKEVPKKFKYYSDIFMAEKEKTLRSFWTKQYMYDKVIEFFKDRNVNEITRLDVKRYINALEVKTNETRVKYLSVIRNVLDLAVDDQEITQNVAIGITMSKEQRLKRIEYFEKKEVALLLNDQEDTELNLFLQIGFNTGLRPEEILGLKKTDIKNGFAKVQRVKVNGNISELLKTQSSRRTIPFNVDISSLNSKSFYLFPNIKGTDSFRKRWAKLLEKYNLKHRGIKNTRHTFATHLLKDDIVTINELSGILGHSKVSTTLSYYASVIDSHNTEVSNKLKSLCYHSVTLERNEEVDKVLKSR